MGHLNRWRFYLRIFSQVSIVCAIAAISSLPALAGVRPFGADVASTFFSSSSLHGTFGAGGVFGIAGGVLFHGQAKFYHEDAAGADTPISAKDVSLVVGDDHSVAIEYLGTPYRFDMHAGLACPLARFMARNGQIVYSKPPFGVSDKTRAAGLVAIPGDEEDMVAKEFSKSHFVDLLSAADYDDNMEALSEELTKKLLQSAGNRSGKSQDSDKADSWLNIDQQVTYKVYLIDASKSVDVSGVPLRYYWKLGGSEVSFLEDRPASVINVEAYSQEFSDGTTLSDFQEPDVTPTHYDVVSLFQSAAVFRELHLDAPKTFAKFVTGTCGRRHAVH